MTATTLGELHFSLLSKIAPASFYDLRQAYTPVNALMFRTRSPIKPTVELREQPYKTKVLPFSLSAIMCGATQVGMVIYHPPGMILELLANTATIGTPAARKGIDLSVAQPVMKLSDLIIFDFASKNAIVAIRVDKRN